MEGAHAVQEVVTPVVEGRGADGLTARGGLSVVIPSQGSRQQGLPPSGESRGAGTGLQNWSPRRAVRVQRPGESQRRGATRVEGASAGVPRRTSVVAKKDLYVEQQRSNMLARRVLVLSEGRDAVPSERRGGTGQLEGDRVHAPRTNMYPLSPPSDMEQLSNELVHAQRQLRLSQQNYKLLSQRTRQLEKSHGRAEAAIQKLTQTLEGTKQMNSKLRRAKEESAKRAEKSEQEAKQMAAHVRIVEERLSSSQGKLREEQNGKKRLSSAAAKWKNERKELGSYALALEKELKAVKAHNAEIKRALEAAQDVGYLSDSQQAVQAAESLAMVLYQSKGSGALTVANAESQRAVAERTGHLQTMIDKLRVALASMRREVENLRTKQSMHAEEVSGLRANISAHEHKERALRLENEELRETSGQFQQLISKHHSADDKNQLIESQARNVVLGSAAQAARSQSNQLRASLAAMSEQLSLSRSALTSAQIEADDAKHARDSANELVAKLNQIRMSLESQLESSTLQLTAVKKELGARKADLVAAEHQLMAFASRKDSSSQNFGSVLQQRDELQFALDAAMEKMRGMQSEIDTIKASAERGDAQRAILEATNASQRKDLEESLQKLSHQNDAKTSSEGLLQQSISERNAALEQLAAAKVKIESLRETITIKDRLFEEHVEEAKRLSKDNDKLKLSIEALHAELSIFRQGQGDSLGSMPEQDNGDDDVDSLSDDDGEDDSIMYHIPSGEGPALY